MISGTSARYSADLDRRASLANDITRLQDQISTGKRLAAPSDDPAGNARLGAIRREQADDVAYAANVGIAAATATRADSAMSSLSTTLDRAKELVTQARSGTYTADERAVAAGQLRSLASEVTAIARQRDTNGQALFPDAPLLIPIGPGQQVQPTISYGALFGITNADGTKTDLPTLLNDAADAVETVDDATRATKTGTSLDAITAAASQVINVRADQGIRAATIDARRDTLATAATALTTERSGIEDTDISAAITLITTKMTTLNAANAVFAKVSRQTLFDVIG